MKLSRIALLTFVCALFALHFAPPSHAKARRHKRCTARCAKVRVKCGGKSPCRRPIIKRKGCVCPTIYKPVCGTDGKTYSNRCRASCKKVGVKCPGKCPCGKKKK